MECLQSVIFCPGLRNFRAQYSFCGKPVWPDGCSYSVSDGGCFRTREEKLLYMGVNQCEVFVLFCFVCEVGVGVGPGY